MPQIINNFLWLKRTIIIAILGILWAGISSDVYSNTEAEIGYSGHEFGLVTTLATVPMGVTWIERHITLDRTLWGSDQMASVEPGGLIKRVKGVRDIEKAMGGYGPRKVIGSELEKMKSLRK